MDSNLIFSGLSFQSFPNLLYSFDTLFLSLSLKINTAYCTVAKYRCTVSFSIKNEIVYP